MKLFDFFRKKEEQNITINTDQTNTADKTNELIKHEFDTIRLKANDYHAWLLGSLERIQLYLQRDGVKASLLAHQLSGAHSSINTPARKLNSLIYDPFKCPEFPQSAIIHSCTKFKIGLKQDALTELEKYARRYNKQMNLYVKLENNSYLGWAYKCIGLDDHASDLWHRVTNEIENQIPESIKAISFAKLAKAQIEAGDFESCLITQSRIKPYSNIQEDKLNWFVEKVLNKETHEKFQNIHLSPFLSELEFEEHLEHLANFNYKMALKEIKRVYTSLHPYEIQLLLSSFAVKCYEDTITIK